MSGDASNVAQYESGLLNRRYLTELDRRIEQLTKGECVVALNQLEYLKQRVRDRVVDLVVKEVPDA